MRISLRSFSTLDRDAGENASVVTVRAARRLASSLMVALVLDVLFVDQLD